MRLTSPFISYIAFLTSEGIYSAKEAYYLTTREVGGGRDIKIQEERERERPVEQQLTHLRFLPRGYDYRRFAGIQDFTEDVAIDTQDGITIFSW